MKAELSYSVNANEAKVVKSSLLSLLATGLVDDLTKVNVNHGGISTSDFEELLGLVNCLSLSKFFRVVSYRDEYYEGELIPETVLQEGCNLATVNSILLKAMESFRWAAMKIEEGTQVWILHLEGSRAIRVVGL